MTVKKRIGFLLIRLLIVAAIASVLQLILWNWSNWKFLLDHSTQKNVVYTLQDFETQNWAETGSQMTSSHDPMLIRDGVDGYVRQVRIDLDADPMPPYIQVYYTNSAHPSFDGEAVVTAQPVSAVTVIDVNDDVQSMRVDLGDDPGTALRAINVTVNPVELHFSISIVVAAELIYLCGKLLFSLQRAPDYGLSEIAPNEGKERKA